MVRRTPTNGKDPTLIGELTEERIMELGLKVELFFKGYLQAQQENKGGYLILSIKTSIKG